jgi:hypothetical protein
MLFQQIAFNYTTNYNGDCCISLIAYNNICADTATKCVKVISEFELLIPNVFTPNGDQANEVFKILSKGLKTLRCEIYNRWGMRYMNGMISMVIGMEKQKLE